MTIIRQQSLFGIPELFEIEPTQRYESVISAIDLDIIYHKANKKSRLGVPVELNYPAIIIRFLPDTLSRFQRSKT